MYSFIMSIAGDREYLEGDEFKILENGYLKKEQDFSGFVLFHELTGEFTNGWVYCDGKITNTIVEADKLGVNLNLKQLQFIIMFGLKHVPIIFTLTLSMEKLQR